MKEPGSGLEGKFFSTIFLSIPTLLVVGPLSTIALLLARRWVAAALAVPMTIGVFIGLYLFLVFVMPSAPAVIFVVLLLLLNGGTLARSVVPHTHVQVNSELLEDF